MDWLIKENKENESMTKINKLRMHILKDDF